MTLALLAGSQAALHLLLTHVTHPGSSAGPIAMTAAHVAATLLAVWLHTRAGQAFDVLAAALRGLVRALSAPPSSPAATPPRPAFPRVGALLAVVMRVVCGRRGPPVLS
ncbi:hypothetical protein ACFQV2_39015 [Actinokineospora soli]|uniref:Low temperature requirement A protein (LtrA) n=1 Tax=Actinokineospora soli TaxID=1048753 RepID=A0ABW2U140_9PSEU